jgi:hypothetical protein
MMNRQVTKTEVDAPTKESGAIAQNQCVEFSTLGTSTRDMHSLLGRTDLPLMHSDRM